MRESLKSIYEVLTTDEVLLRLLYYNSKNDKDNPLEESKGNILDKDDVDRWNIIEDVIKKDSSVNDLENSQEKCRICFYSGARKKRQNYLISSQDIIFDIYTHININDVDFRLSWICDRLNKLIFSKDIMKLGKIYFKSGSKISSPTGYEGYRIIFSFEDKN